MELFPMDSVLELNTKKLGNSPRFLTITHMTLFALWFGSYHYSYDSVRSMVWKLWNFDDRHHC
jgi:hypothetical protein